MVQVGDGREFLEQGEALVDIFRMLVMHGCPVRRVEDLVERDIMVPSLDELRSGHQRFSRDLLTCHYDFSLVFCLIDPFQGLA